MNEAIPQFKDAIRKAGLEPPEVIEPGKLHRFPGLGKGKDNKAGWCFLFEDGLGGCLGDWSTGLKEHWRANPDRQFSQSEEEAYRRNTEAACKRAEEERQQAYSNAAREAASIWKDAESVPDDFPYLTEKGIKAHGMRLHEGTLTIPVYIDDEIVSLQYIDEDGKKRFLEGGKTAGGYCWLGEVENAETVCIAEGFATGASIREATGYPVVVAFNAHNLESVAKVIKQKLPDAQIIICADDDSKTEGNPGVTCANKAALSIGAKVAKPVFEDSHSEDATDFNDMAAQAGLEEVAKAVNAAKQPDSDWSDPEPLVITAKPEPYPLDALPDTIRAAVKEVQSFVKAPVPLVASSALSAVSLAVQAHVDVKLDKLLVGPVSLFVLTIADPGERKTTCDRYFMDAVREYEAGQENLARLKRKEYKVVSNSYEAKSRGIESKIRELSNQGKPTQKEEEALKKLEEDHPSLPRVPRLLFADVTPEGLVKSFSEGWPTGGIISNEGGLVFGSHGMNKDSVIRNLSTYNKLWDGEGFPVDRATSESLKIYGARLTIGLQVQEAVLQSFLKQNGTLARGGGFLSRVLISYPESTQGTRLYTDPPEGTPALDRFKKRITEILEREPAFEEGILAPSVLVLSAQAKRVWIEFYNTTEGKLGRSGELFGIKDVATKIADNAARLSALFEYFEYDGSESIRLEMCEKASRIADWYLNEALRLYGKFSLSEDQDDMKNLDEWLIDYCQRNNTNVISRREVQQRVTPIRLRKGEMLDASLKDLEDKGRVRTFNEGKRKDIQVNPALLDGKSYNGCQIN